MENGVSQEMQAAMINTKNWETQPSFSSDGKTLYFIRGMVARDGIKNPDIYSSTIGEDGKFSEPVKLSDNINTSWEKKVCLYIQIIKLYILVVKVILEWEV
jgi:peptidoglycan-associated lipoprotein